MRWGNGFLIHMRKDNMHIIYIYTNTQRVIRENEACIKHADPYGK
jgi:hypothetical protein